MPSLNFIPLTINLKYNEQLIENKRNDCIRINNNGNYYSCIGCHLSVRR